MIHYQWFGGGCGGGFGGVVRVTVLTAWMRVLKGDKVSPLSFEEEYTDR